MCEHEPTLAVYAWGRSTSDQVLILPSDRIGEEDPDSGGGGLVPSVRFNCGLVFTFGDHQAESPAAMRRAPRSSHCRCSVALCSPCSAS